MNYTEKQFEAFIHLRDSLAFSSDDELNEELHEEAIIA